MSQKVKRAVEKVEKLGRELESAKQQNEPEDQCRRLVKDVLFLCLSFTTYILLPYTRSMSVQVQTDPTCTIRGEGRGRPICMAFENYVRALMATGCSSRSAKDSVALSASFWSSDDRQIMEEIPKINWFCLQREALGAESYLYSFLRIAAATSIPQWGFDETSLDGKATFNQWCMIKDDDESYAIVSIECAGLLVGSTAEEIAVHVEAAWARGQAAVEALRHELGDEYKDILAPLVEGGVSLHKIKSVMHDTCNTANLVAKKVTHTLALTVTPTLTLSQTRTRTQTGD